MQLEPKLKKKVVSWLILIPMFGIVLFFRDDLTAENVVLRFLLFLLIAHFFVVPFLTQEDMRVPGKTYILSREKDKPLRFAVMVAGVYFLVKILFF